MRSSQPSKPIRPVPPLEAGASAVWKIDLDEEVKRSGTHFDQLSEAERESSTRLRQSRKRDCFIVTRSILRGLLEHYSGLTADRLRIRSNPHGKPYIDGIEFNISHSRGWALMVFNRSRQVGIDIQHMKPALDFARIARRRYTESERKQIFARADIEAQRDAFFAIWTRKEAYVKAHGSSFYDKISVLDLPQGRERIDDALLGGTWELRTFKIGGDYWASICAENSIGDCRVFDWDIYRPGMALV